MFKPALLSQRVGFKVSRSPVFMFSWGSHLAAASVSSGELRSRAWRTAFPAGRARPRSWPWTACTCGIGPAAARQRSVSHATGGRDLGPASGPQGGCCGGTSCTGGRPHHPILWCQCQNLLIMERHQLFRPHYSERGSLFWYANISQGTLTPGGMLIKSPDYILSVRSDIRFFFYLQGCPVPGRQRNFKADCAFCTTVLAGVFKPATLNNTCAWVPACSCSFNATRMSLSPLQINGDGCNYSPAGTFYSTFFYKIAWSFKKGHQMHSLNVLLKGKNPV